MSQTVSDVGCEDGGDEFIPYLPSIPPIPLYTPPYPLYLQYDFIDWTEGITTLHPNLFQQCTEKNMSEEQETIVTIFVYIFSLFGPDLFWDLVDDGCNRAGAHAMEVITVIRSMAVFEILWLLTSSTLPTV